MKPAVTLLFLFTCAIASSQNNHLHIDRPTIKQLPEIEKANYGNVHWPPNHVEYFPAPHEIPNSDKYHFAQPISSRRHTKPWETSVRYYYSVPDSVIRMVEYTWTLPDTTSTLFLFNANEKQFDGLFKQKGKLFIDNKEIWRTAKWENDMVQVSQSIAMSAVRPGGSRDYHIIVRMSWK